MIWNHSQFAAVWETIPKCWTPFPLFSPCFIQLVFLQSPECLSAFHIKNRDLAAFHHWILKRRFRKRYKHCRESAQKMNWPWFKAAVLSGLRRPWPSRLRVPSLSCNYRRSQRSWDEIDRYLWMAELETAAANEGFSQNDAEHAPLFVGACFHSFTWIYSPESDTQMNKLQRQKVGSFLNSLISKTKRHSERDHTFCSVVSSTCGHRRHCSKKLTFVSVCL